LIGLSIGGDRKKEYPTIEQGISNDEVVRLEML
jgi:hypothetical protein